MLRGIDRIEHLLALGRFGGQSKTEAIRMKQGNTDTSLFFSLGQLATILIPPKLRGPLDSKYTVGVIVDVDKKSARVWTAR